MTEPCGVLHTHAMTTTKYAEQVRPNRVAATVDRDGARIGHVISRGRTFEANRKQGQAGVDVRKVNRFRSLAAAVAWVELSGQASANADLYDLAR